MHDNDPGDDHKPGTGEKQLSRVLWFMRSAFKTTGIVMGDGDIARLAMGFHNALYEDGGIILFEPRIEELTQ